MYYVPVGYGASAKPHLYFTTGTANEFQLKGHFQEDGGYLKLCVKKDSEAPLRSTGRSARARW